MESMLTMENGHGRFNCLKNVLQQNSHVAMEKDVFHPDINAMVTMTVGTTQMKGIVQVNSINAQ